MKKKFAAIIGITLLVLIMLPGCVAHGGGWFTTDGGNKVTLGFDTDEGNFTLIEHNKRDSNKLIGEIEGGCKILNGAKIWGECKWNGDDAWFCVWAKDRGEGINEWGAGDWITVIVGIDGTIVKVYDYPLMGGNLQIGIADD